MVFINKLKSYYSLLFSYLTKGNSRSVKAKKNILASFGIKGVSIIIGFVFVPLILGYLDAERYGIWLTLSSIIAWVQFFNIGLGHGLRNRFAEAIAMGDNHLARIYVSTTYVIIGGIAIITLIFFNIINPFLNWQRILNTTVVDESKLSIIALIVFAFFMFRFFFKLIGNILLADQRPAISNAFGPISNVLNLIIIFVLTKTTEGSLIKLSLVLSLVPVIVLIVATFYFFSRDYKLYRPSIKYIDFNKSKDLLNLGFNFFFIQIAVLVLYQSSLFIIAKLFGPTEVTSYFIAHKYFSVITMVSGIVMAPFWSAFTEAFTKGDIIWIKKIMKKLRRIWIVFSIIIIVMLVFSNYIYKIWVGTEIYISFPISLSLALYVMINSWNAIYTGFLNGVGKIKLQLYFSIGHSILFIPIAIILGRYIGVAGIILTSCILVLMNAIWEPIQYNKIIKNKANGIWGK